MFAKFLSMSQPHPNNPATWKKYRNGLCEGCWAACCTMPVEACATDLIRLGLADAHEIEETPKKVAKRLIKSGEVTSYRAATGIFILARQASGDCIYLDKNRRCRVYDQRPDVCRHFPHVSSRPGYCPSFKIPSKTRSLN